MNYLKSAKQFFLSGAFRSLALLFIVGLLFVNFRQRQIAVAEINDNLARFELSRSMLDSRARIQVILVSAALEGRKLSPTEVDQITRLWKSAEYDRAYELQ